MKFAAVILLIAAPAFADGYRAGRWARKEAVREAKLAKVDAKIAAREAKIESKSTKGAALRGYWAGRHQYNRERQAYRRELLRDLRSNRQYHRPDHTGMKRIL